MMTSNPPIIENKTIDETKKSFLFHCQYEKNLSEKTIYAYDSDISQFLFYLKNKSILYVTAIDKFLLKDYLQELSKFKPKTIKRKIASLKAMFNYLEYEDDFFVNPFRKMKIRIKEPYTLPTVMNLEEIKQIFQVHYKEIDKNLTKDNYTFKSQTRNIAVAELLFSTGIRVSELCHLKVSDIDLNRGEIKVFGKGSKERIIQICNKETLELLKSYKLLFKNHIGPGNHFFVNRLGNPLSSQSVRLMIKHYAKKAGLSKKITPHTFRHTFATLLLEEDVDIKYIQQLLGHSSISTTQLYTHVNLEKQKQILAKHPRRKLSFWG